MNRNQIVRDREGNRFRITHIGDDLACIESVATKELFTAPISELFATGRVAF